MRSLLAVVLVFISVSAHCLTMYTETFTCPLCETQFTARVPGSSSTFGQRLDFRPLGATCAPCALPVCPNDGFVRIGKDFSEEELSLLREFVASEAYKAPAASNFEKAARLEQALGRLWATKHPREG